MREMLFRGIGENTDRWEFGNLVKFANGDCAIINGSGSDSYLLIHVIPETVGQYTGLKDKNGVNIFEGDVVGYLNSIESGNGVVIFDACAFLFNWIDIDETDSLLRYFQCSKELEVIGNIHDNPELMGETK